MRKYRRRQGEAVQKEARWGSKGRGTVRKYWKRHCEAVQEEAR